MTPSRKDLIVHIEAGEDGNVWLSKSEIARIFEVFYAAVSANIDIELHESYVTAEKVKNTFLGYTIVLSAS